jgi:single-strand DNA-binding protein
MNVFGIARLGRDAELKYLNDGTAVARVSLAFSVGKKNDKKTTWVEGTLWGKQADSLCKYLTTGKSIGVVLEDLRLDEYEKKDGTRGSKLVARINKIEFAGANDERQQDSTFEEKQPNRAALAQNVVDTADDIPW